MPQYCFHCRGGKHPPSDPEGGRFVAFIHLERAQLKRGKIIDHFPCPLCGDYAGRDMERELISQSVVGSTPVSPSSSVKGTFHHAAKFAFGSADGSVPFKDSGEMARFLDGNNELGPPIVDDNGNPLRRPDGTFRRRGEKFVKYDRQATPSRSAPLPNRSLPDAFIEGGEVAGFIGRGVHAESVPGVHHPVPYHVSPRRKPKRPK